MKRFALAAFAALLMSCSPAEQAAETAPEPGVQAEAGDPTELVRAIYAAVTAADARTVQAPEQRYTAGLKALWDAYDATNAEGLGFDPFVNGQDAVIEAVAIALEAPPHEGEAVVSASFVTYGEQNELRFDMRLEEGQWRIDNIRSLSEPAWNLRDLLSPA